MDIQCTYFPDVPLTNQDYHHTVGSSRDRSLMPIHHHSNQYGKSFFRGAINAWNSLPSSIQTSTTIGFKYALILSTLLLSIYYALQ